MKKIMKLSIEEKLMYEVMMAIYESGIPMSFKGSMVLKACLFDAGFLEETRHTIDIDGNWISDSVPTQEQMTNSIQNSLKLKNLPYIVRSSRVFGEGRSAGFELLDESSGERLFSMDIDVNRPVSSTKIYELDGMSFLGASPSQIIADKISVISTNKVFRRIKDIVDLYYLSRVFAINKSDVVKALNDMNKSIDDFDGFLNHKEELKHSYDKFRLIGNISKPSFDHVHMAVKEFIHDFLPNV